MSYHTKSQHFVTCDVCQEAATSIGQKSNGDALDFALLNGWKSFLGDDRHRARIDPWHACPACRESQEFHLGLPAIKALIERGHDPRRTWPQVHALVQAGLIVGPPESDSAK